MCGRPARNPQASRVQQLIAGPARWNYVTSTLMKFASAIRPIFPTRASRPYSRLHRCLASSSFIRTRLLASTVVAADATNRAGVLQEV